MGCGSSSNSGDGQSLVRRTIFQQQLEIRKKREQEERTKIEQEEAKEGDKDKKNEQTKEKEEPKQETEEKKLPDLKSPEDKQKEMDDVKEILRQQSQADDGGDKPEQVKQQEEEVKQNEEQPKNNDQPKQDESNKSSQFPNGYVIRREIRTLSAQDQERFLNAMKNMTKSTNGPGTSEFFRVAGYHGWPSNFCHHGQETFPVWHRAYLVEMERALIASDIELGNDGNIGLPYWDWSKEEINGQFFPKVVREGWTDLPDDFFTEKDKEHNDLWDLKFSRRKTDEQMKQVMKDSDTIDQSQICLLQQQHWKHASTRWQGEVSIESPHNHVHMAVGFPMSTLSYASFDLAFHLHHCNIDRIFQKYLTMEPDSEEEFSNMQEMLSEQRRETNRYVAPLEPFKHPFTKKKFMCEDGYQDTRHIGFEYDELPATPPQQIRQFPTFAVFKDINPLNMNKKSYLLHVFAVYKDVADKFEPPASVDQYKDCKEYAGVTSIFGGKGKECQNCVERDAFILLVDISKSMNKQLLSRYQVELVVMCEDEKADVMPLKDAVGVTKPVIRGPFFEKSMDNLEQSDELTGDVEPLQEYLKLLGYYEDKIDRQFGPNTRQAVESFQEQNQLVKDGVAGPMTKNQIRQMRYDMDRDVNSESKATFSGPANIKYFVGVHPGNLNQEVLYEELQEAFGQWKDTGAIASCRQTFNRKEANLIIQWNDRSQDNLFLFDGLGGNLAHSTKEYIDLDISERWQTREMASKDQNYKVFNVVLHELGHVLGLGHSSDFKAVMSPYYQENNQKLTEDDIKRVKQLYKIE